MKKFIIGLAVFTGLMMSAPYTASADIESGKKLVKQKCGGCHALDKKRMGPALNGIGTRAGAEWIKSWLTDSKKVWNENKGYTKTLREKHTYKSSKHRTPSLSDEKRNDIVEFLATLTTK